jgi:phosphate-selective porin OprO/OprP
MTLRKILLAGTALGAAAIMAGPAFAGSAATTQAEIDALKQQMQVLQQKLDDMQIQTSDALTSVRNIVTMPNGHPTFKSLDGNFEASIGGRLQMDAYGVDADNTATSQIGRSRWGAEIRRARMNMAGRLWDWKYKIEADFANNGVSLKDVVLQHDFFIYGAGISIGNQYEPFGLDNITSDNYNTFMEFSLPVKLRTDRNLGIVLNYSNATNWGAAAGIFSDNKVSQPAAKDTTDWSVSGRGWFTPINDSSSNTVLHLGFDGRYQAYEGGSTGGGASGGITAIPEANGAGNTLNTGSISNISDDYRYGPEVAFQYGPFEAQAEYTWMTIERNNLRNIDLKGGYGEVSYFLTGDSRNYDVKGGVFGRPNVSAGAVQIAARYSTMDISDVVGAGGIGTVTMRTGPALVGGLAGKENDITLGANYYWSPNVRLMLNYVNADINYVTTKDETDNIIETRLQLDW